MVIWERAAGVMEGWAELVAVILIFERLMLARRSRVGWVSSTVMQYDCMQEARSRSSSMLVFTFFWNLKAYPSTPASCLSMVLVAGRLVPVIAALTIFAARSHRFP